MEINKEELKKSINEYIKLLFRKNLSDASGWQKFHGVAYALKNYIVEQWINTHNLFEEKDVKTVYYLSMEFLMGRALGNMIINLKADNVVREALEELNIDLDAIEDEEMDAALGNGGLGRLAACFLDSLSTLGYAAYGCGIRYKYGMFEQKIENGYQVEVPDNWLIHGNPFEIKRPEYAAIIKFGGYVKMIRDENGRDRFIQEDYQSILATPYDLPVVGYGNGVVNTLRIWEASAVNNFNLDAFDRGEYEKSIEDENLARTICEVLYPNDNHIWGKELRLKQQYFFVSASVQRAVIKYMEQHNDITKLHEKVCFQLNDTHPSVAVPELMRILLDDYLLPWDMAWDISVKTLAYTNHTIMSEALEVWEIDLFKKLLPRIYQIVEEINYRLIVDIRKFYHGDENKVRNMAILYDGKVRMAYLSITGCFSVNGVARLHTDILKNKVLKDFYEYTPYKFNNKTNGITQRRFLLHGNPLLADWITSRIGDGWITDLYCMKDLVKYANDLEAQKEFMEIKYKNKLRLAGYIKEYNGITVDPNGIFDIQVKRLHEYKRQLLNILHIMYLYQKIKKNKEMEFYKKTFIFGAKASAGYHRAKSIIKLIHNVADIINNDITIEDKIKVVFIENYRVSNGELLFAAADVSEQISTASKEASGTGNMKFMLNGALTIGTLDGANVEIVEEVSSENAFIFGLTANEVIKYEMEGGYNAREIYEKDEDIKDVVDSLIDGTYSKGDNNLFYDIYNSLIGDIGEPTDKYFILKDFRSYDDARYRVEHLYKDKSSWARAAILNTANSGKFSSDRTISEYVKDIWFLDKVTI